MYKSLRLSCCLLTLVNASCAIFPFKKKPSAVGCPCTSAQPEAIYQRARIVQTLEGMEASGMAMVNLERSQTVDSVAMQSRPKAKTEHLATVTSLRAGYLNQYVRRLHSLRQENPLWVEIELQERIHQYKNRYETRKKVSELMLHHFKLDSLHLKGSNTDLLQDFDSLYLKLH